MSFEEIPQPCRYPGHLIRLQEYCDVVPILHAELRLSHT
jgi:hypothetical protein